jgi:RNA polymerase sigma-70 factor (ECF subfamily)
LKTSDRELDERRLIEAAQKDSRRFAELYERNFERVYAYVVRRVGNRDAAEDLTSEVFHKALANIARFEWRGVPLAAWLFQIARNAIADYWRRTAREGNPQPEDTEEINLEEVEQRATLFRLVRSLRLDQRRVILQRFVEGKSTGEIAQEMGRTAGAVKQLQFRALQILRAQMRQANG